MKITTLVFVGKIESRSSVTVVVTCKLITMIPRFYHFMENRWEKNENSDRLYFLGYKITVDGDCSHEIKRHLLLGRKVMTNLDSILKKQRHFSNKCPSSQWYDFSSSHI